MFLVRLRDGGHHLVGYQVRVRAPCDHEDLALIIRIDDRLQISKLRPCAGGAQNPLHDVRGASMRRESLQTDEDSKPEGAGGAHDETGPAPPPQHERLPIDRTGGQHSLQIRSVHETDDEIIRAGAADQNCATINAKVLLQMLQDHCQSDGRPSPHDHRQESEQQRVLGCLQCRGARDDDKAKQR